MPRQFGAALRSGHLRVDIAPVQVSRRRRRFTLVSLPIHPSAACAPRLVVALVNPALPATGGDAWVDSEDIDLFVESDDRLIDMPDPAPSAVEGAVAQQVAALIPDRATVQLGVGTLPAAVTRALSDIASWGPQRRCVRCSSTSSSGRVTNAHKGMRSGRSVTGGLFGTRLAQLRGA